MAGGLRRVGSRALLLRSDQERRRWVVALSGYLQRRCRAFDAGVKLHAASAISRRHSQNQPTGSSIARRLAVHALPTDGHNLDLIFRDGPCRGGEDCRKR
jgi:hypothetical protein